MAGQQGGQQEGDLLRRKTGEFRRKMPHPGDGRVSGNRWAACLKSGKSVCLNGYEKERNVRLKGCENAQMLAWMVVFSGGLNHAGYPH
jgi:hypothetical protein